MVLVPLLLTGKLVGDDWLNASQIGDHAWTMWLGSADHTEQHRVATSRR
jgi:hypothetical protein